MCQLARQPFYQLSPVFGALLALLFFLDDATTYVPISLDHRTAHRAISLSTTIIDDCPHIAHKGWRETV